MDIPYDDIFTVIRHANDPRKAFDALRGIGKARLKSPVWDAIQTPDCEADVEAATAWLTGELGEYRPTGVYLGLDTLNERNGNGKNVEIGMTVQADPGPLAMEWAWNCEQYGGEHLIKGMFEAHQSYENAELEFEDSLLADYLFFFGYSGIVLASAIERVPVRWDSLFVWGFHDGDLGFLARSSTSGVTRLATFGQG